MIRGPTANIVGEVQFLLQTMVNYKNIAHNLYAIQRDEEFIASASKILPALLDQKQQFGINMALNNINACYGLCVFSNLKGEHIDTKVKENIMFSAWRKPQSYKFMMSFMKRSEMT